MPRVLLSLFVVVIGCSFFTFKDAAAYGYIAVVDCDNGLGLVPSGAPDPNILCEMTWEQTGPQRVQGGRLEGSLSVNGVFATSKSTGIFRFDSTVQPVPIYVGCSNITPPPLMVLTAYAYMYEKAPPKEGGGWHVYDFRSDYGIEEVPSNGGAGCSLGGG